MNFGTIGGFVARNGKSILKKTALAAGVIAGLAFLTDTPDEATEELETEAEFAKDEVVETTAVEVTEEEK